METYYDLIRRTGNVFISYKHSACLLNLSRLPIQILRNTSQFVTWFHSSNTATISEDTKNYLSLLSQDYLAKRTEELKSSGVYALVKESFFVSTTKIESVKIIKRGGFGNEPWEAVVSSATKIEGDHNGSSHTAKFKDRIRFYLAPRTEINPLGIRDVTVL